MKMTSDTGNGDAASAKQEVSDCGPTAASSKAGSLPVTVTASNREAKNRLTFSIDSLVGKNRKEEVDERPPTVDGEAIRGTFSEGTNSFRNRSPSPSAKRHCPPQPRLSQPLQQSPAKMAALSRTPPANGTEFAAIADQHQQRFVRQSAFMPPSVSSGPSASSFASPVSLTGPSSGNHLCWELASVEPTAGLWKDAVAASAMYQAAAAAALYTGYHPWYSPAAPIGPHEMAKRQQLLLQQDQQSMALMASPPEAITRSDPRHQGQNHGQAAGMASSAADQQSQTFWHHHIAELLRQNGGHPVHHSRLYAGPDAGHAAASFLFSGCRKPKRIRTAFSPNQLMELEAAFEKNQYVVGNERKELARRLALTETQVKVWFQNRRTKAKRMKNEDTVGTPGAASTTSSASSATTKTTTTTAAAYHQMHPDDAVVGSGHESRLDHIDKETLEISVSNGQKSSGGIDRGPSSLSSVTDENERARNGDEMNEAEFQSSDEDSN